ncbi:MAG: DUF1302 family protein [Bacteroidales bacterium]|jgi:hypothetical protein|nr:hypothetical protein [Bacteroidales bacterium]MDY0370056.1 hypothetical protein [Bacteroidales bacterium]
MNTRSLLLIPLFVLFCSAVLIAQEDAGLRLYGELKTDQRILLKDKNNWAWNENRLTLKLDKRISGSSKFYGEMWIRNLGLPTVYSISDLYNKGIADPFQFELRQAYVRLQDFPIKNMDISLGRQHITWGTADKLNPTNNLNPYDLEDLLDFGRQRGTEALDIQYYFNHDFSLQAVYIPFFRPATLPIGVFSNMLNPAMELPPGMIIKQFSDTLMMPAPNFKENASAGLRFKGFIKGMDFSLSYAYTYDGLPLAVNNTFTRLDLAGGTKIESELTYARTHVFGADIATTLGGFGIWGEAAVILPQKDIIMHNDLSGYYTGLPFPVTYDTIVMNKKEPYVRFVVGSDYNFPDGSYMNLQYMHGFIHEHGQGNLNDYFFLRYEKSFFREKLKLSPVSGAFIVTDWNALKSNYTVVYMPEVSFMATPNTELRLSAVLSDGQGDNLFARLKDFNMLIFKIAYSF